MGIEVCVVTYNSSQTLGRLVDSLAMMPHGTTLAVHDNSPAGADLDAAAALAASAGISLRAETCATGNCGFAAGCNGLAAGSSADELLFLNPDAALQTWPADLNALEGIVGPVIVGPDGRRTVTYGVQRTLRDEVALRWLRRKPTKPSGRGYVSGAALLVGRRGFLALGGFDEQFFMYYEDIDLCLRAGRAGLRVELREDWVVAHTGGASVGTSVEGLTRAHLSSYRSGRRFHAQHGHSVRGYDVLCLTDAALRAALRSTRRAGRGRAAADWAVARSALAALRAPAVASVKRTSRSGV